MKERVEVVSVSDVEVDTNFTHGRFMLKPKFVITNKDFKDFDRFEASIFLASQLEKYLNKEIE